MDIAMLRPPHLSEIISRDPVCVAAGTTLLQAMAAMEANNVTGVVVTEGKCPIGILTERDVLRTLASGVSFESLIVGSVMSSPPVTAPPNLDCFEASHLCVQKNIRHLIVVDDLGELCGIVSESDFLRILGGDVLTNTHVITDDITRLPLLLPPEMPLFEAVRYMSGEKGGAAIAAVDGKPVGVLTERDVVRLGQRAIDANTTLADVMTQPVLTVPVGSSAYHAIDLMRNRCLRRLGVVDSEGHIIGMLTEHEIVRRIENRYVEFLSSIIDRQIEDINKARNQLSESAVLTSILRESLDMGLLAADTDGQIRYLNPEAAKILGVSPTEAIGRSLTELARQAGLDDHQIHAGIEMAGGGGALPIRVEPQTCRRCAGTLRPHRTHHGRKLCHAGLRANPAGRYRAQAR